MRAYPTARAIVLMAAGAPVGLIVGLIAPGLWAAAAAWILFGAGLLLADMILAPRPASVELRTAGPTVMGVGRPARAEAAAAFAAGAPRQVEFALGANARLGVAPARTRARTAERMARASFELTPLRRGEGRIERLWARWRGPLGLMWLQRSEPQSAEIAVTPDMEGVRDQALRLFTRDAPLGLKPQIDTGEGADFHALRDFQTGMDLRAIDWKQSARHGKLVGREYRTERNHHVILALDCGRLMSAPVDGAPRVDHAINAALLLAFVSLKLGDRVGLFAFDARPRVASGVAAGPQAFPLIQKLAAAVDYSTEETNFTLGFTTLAGRLERRSLVVVFSEFADPTSAELMIENLGRLMRTHLVLFVVFQDEELARLAGKEPLDPDDVSRAVIAGRLLRQREVVVERLRRMGAQIIEAPPRALGPALLDHYFAAKRRELL